ncbi:hypothetical protein OIU84_015491 [Salix udensis]|uniref:Uncharacterized protein n=1 Tax=Salix udensis TaxID=889485 RepID=A0AAD6J7I0_9ROSI|nr:hypothetical protein OIU84_015491 [Salix udensis]
MLDLEGQEIHQSNLGWSPLSMLSQTLGVMSIGFMLRTRMKLVIWRGPPRKNGFIKQFLKDVYWGELDFLVVDAPPGTSDEHILIVQYLQATRIDGAIIVTTPQQVSLIDVRKEVSFCKKVRVEVLGVVENMSGLCQRLTNFRFAKLMENDEQNDITEKVLGPNPNKDQSKRENLADNPDIKAQKPTRKDIKAGAEKAHKEKQPKEQGKSAHNPSNPSSRPKKSSNRRHTQLGGKKRQNTRSSQFEIKFKLGAQPQRRLPSRTKLPPHATPRLPKEWKCQPLEKQLPIA